MNVAVISGNLTKDIDLKTTPNGVSTCSFTVAVRRAYKNADGEYGTDFINCVAWRSNADFISKYFKKGQGIAIKGNIQTRTWDDQEGKRHYATEVIVEQADFLGGKNGDSSKQTPNESFENDSALDDLPDFDDIPDDDDCPF